MNHVPRASWLPCLSLVRNPVHQSDQHGVGTNSSTLPHRGSTFECPGTRWTSIQEGFARLLLNRFFFLRKGAEDSMPGRGRHAWRYSSLRRMKPNM